ncbi:MAG TPA: LysR family transcriptional regulator [Reyranella sp.]
MITLKQLLALHWIAELGTFERAATKLNTTQSAISKRMHELEASTGITIFNRLERRAQLTDEGDQVLVLGRQMLALQEQIVSLKGGENQPFRKLRLGVTELTAFTWLPSLVSAIRTSYPNVMLEPQVDSTRALCESLAEDRIDIIAVPGTSFDSTFTSVPLAKVTNVWVARPGLVKRKRSFKLTDLYGYTILMQGRRSGSGLFLSKWMEGRGIFFPSTIATDSLPALAGLAAAGLGVGYLPRQCFQPLFSKQLLAILPVTPALPAVPYSAVYRHDRPSALTSTIAKLMRTVCDFDRESPAEPLNSIKA